MDMSSIDPIAKDGAVWVPPQKRVEESNLSAFIRAQRDLSSRQHITGYDALYNWSVSHPEEFWPAVWDYCQVISSKRWERVVDNIDDMLKATWFESSRLNFAENLLRFRDNHTALISYSENGLRCALTYGELYQRVACLVRHFKTLGIKPGDRIAGLLPNIHESVIAMLAATSLGAIWSSCSPEFGLQGILDRFGQINPVVLLCSDGYFYNGKTIDILEKVCELSRQLKTLRQIIVIPFVNLRPDLTKLSHGVSWDDVFIQSVESAEIVFEQLPFNHPLYIMYSSGTTGIPKCIVHGAGGTLLQHLKELTLHTDLKRSDKIFYFTTCGWMMWNWLVSSLAVGATVVLYDGAALYPQASALIDLAATEKLTIFGTSAKYLAAIEKSGVKPVQSHDLSSLRTILSTGSPLLPEQFDFVYRDVKHDVLLSSISGGTDIISCFCLGNPLLAVYRGEIQCRGLGMAVKVLDEAGNELRGQPGELVCTKPFPSMPIYFWKDPGGLKFRESYFDVYANMWRHGDWAELSTHNGIIIYGRSDAVLNPGGVRIGTAEIYSIVEQIHEVIDCLAVAQQWQGDERIILFVKLRNGAQLTEPLRDQIKRELRAQATPRHVPAKIIAVPDIPRTMSGKIVELAVRNVIHGRPVKNKDALANPDTLEFFKDLAELQT